MATAVVMVNGLPGAGKSTLAFALGRELGVVVLSKDILKMAIDEAWAATSQSPDERVARDRLGAIAMEVVWLLASAVPGVVVVDSWFFRPRDLEHTRAGLATAGCATSVEVWCDAPVELARRRYAERHRSDLFEDGLRLARDWDHWVRCAEPLGLAPTVVVDTSDVLARVDVATLAERLREHLGDHLVGEVQEPSSATCSGSR